MLFRSVTGKLKQRSYETKEGEKRTSIEVDVEDIGPALRTATAKVTKTSGGGNAGGGRAEAAGGDPWGNATASTAGAWGGAATDEPPF